MPAPPIPIRWARPIPASAGHRQRRDRPGRRRPQRVGARSSTRLRDLDAERRDPLGGVRARPRARRLGPSRPSSLRPPRGPGWRAPAWMTTTPRRAPCGRRPRRPAPGRSPPGGSRWRRGTARGSTAARTRSISATLAPARATTRSASANARSIRSMNGTTDTRNAAPRIDRSRDVAVVAGPGAHEQLQVARATRAPAARRRPPDRGGARPGCRRTRTRSCGRARARTPRTPPRGAGRGATGTVAISRRIGLPVRSTRVPRAGGRRFPRTWSRPPRPIGRRSG